MTGFAPGNGRQFHRHLPCYGPAVGLCKKMKAVFQETVLGSPYQLFDIGRFECKAFVDVAFPVFHHRDTACSRLPKPRSVVRCCDPQAPHLKATSPLEQQRNSAMSMLCIPGQPGKDLCDSHLGVTRRDILRVGGSAFLGMSLGGMLKLQSAQAATLPAAAPTAPGWGRAKSVILIYLQGGPSHLDLWDPKENVPDNVKSVFKKIPSKVPGMETTELLPKLAGVTDKFTFIRSMSYTPVGLFNHTAAIYQFHTGYTADKVSPSGQLEPPTPKEFPNLGSNLIRLKPPTGPGALRFIQCHQQRSRRVFLIAQNTKSLLRPVTNLGGVRSEKRRRLAAGGRHRCRRALARARLRRRHREPPHARSTSTRRSQGQDRALQPAQAGGYRFGVGPHRRGDREGAPRPRVRSRRRRSTSHARESLYEGEAERRRRRSVPKGAGAGDFS